MEKNIKIAFQGEKGAYSHLASLEIFPNAEIKACPTFDETFRLAKENDEYKIVIPIENSLAGRVADIHYLLTKYKLQIYSEHFQKVEHNLLANVGTELKDIKYVRSHAQAIDQCQKIINKHKFKTIISAGIVNPDDREVPTNRSFSGLFAQLRTTTSASTSTTQN